MCWTSDLPRDAVAPFTLHCPAHLQAVARGRVALDAPCFAAHGDGAGHDAADHDEAAPRGSRERPTPPERRCRYCGKRVLSLLALDGHEACREAARERAAEQRVAERYAKRQARQAQEEREKRDAEKGR